MTCIVSDDLYTQLESRYYTPRVRTLLAQTTDLAPIPRYFILDACLSDVFQISLSQARNAWEHQVEKAHQIWTSIPKDIALPYQAARFGMHMLRHLLYQDTNQLVCGYGWEGSNFIVALVKTNQCLCASYTFYVQALAIEVGIGDWIQMCAIPGHIFSFVKRDGVEIRWDAGYENNYHIQVQIVRHAGYQNYLEVYDALGWTPQFMDVVPNWNLSCDKFPSIANDAHETIIDPILYQLWEESLRKKRASTTIRNRIILQRMYPHIPALRTMVYKYLTEEPSLRFWTSNSNTSSHHNEKSSLLEAEYQNVSHCEPHGWRPDKSDYRTLEGRIVAILSQLFPDVMHQMAESGDMIPPDLQWIVNLFQIIWAQLSKWKPREQNMEFDFLPSLGNAGIWVRLQERIHQQEITRWELRLYASTRHVAATRGSLIVSPPGWISWIKPSTFPFETQTIHDLPDETILVMGLQGAVQDRVPLEMFTRDPTHADSSGLAALAQSMVRDLPFYSLVTETEMPIVREELSNKFHDYFAYDAKKPMEVIALRKHGSMRELELYNSHGSLEPHFVLILFSKKQWKAYDDMVPVSSVLYFHPDEWTSNAQNARPSFWFPKNAVLLQFQADGLEEEISSKDLLHETPRMIFAKE